MKYDAAAKLIAVGSTTWNYDAQGNLTSKSDGTQYTYDALGQLTRIDFPDHTYASYQYDALGNRVQKNINGTVTNYAYSGGQILAEYDGSWTLHARYVYAPGIDRPLAMWRDGKWYFFVRDRLGSVRELLDQTGNTVESYDYDAYGAVVGGATGKSVSSLHPFGFASSQYDAESGLCYMRARYYDPAAGRFIERDPWASAGAAHPYQYADGDPISLRDPLGLDDEPGGEVAGSETGGGGEQTEGLIGWVDWSMVMRVAVLEGGSVLGTEYVEHWAEQAFQQAERYATSSEQRLDAADRLAAAFGEGEGNLQSLYNAWESWGNLAANLGEKAESAEATGAGYLADLGYAPMLGKIMPWINTILMAKEGVDYLFFHPTAEKFRNLMLDAAISLAVFGLAFGAYPLLIALFIGFDVAIIVLFFALLVSDALNHADPSFIDPIDPTANVGPLRASPLYLGLAGLADDALSAGQSAPVRSRRRIPGEPEIGRRSGAGATLPFAAARCADRTRRSP